MVERGGGVMSGSRGGYSGSRVGFSGRRLELAIKYN